jgi:hypothetical protein
MHPPLLLHTMPFEPQLAPGLVVQVQVPLELQASRWHMRFSQPPAWSHSVHWLFVQWPLAQSRPVTHSTHLPLLQTPLQVAFAFGRGAEQVPSF